MFINLSNKPEWFLANKNFTVPSIEMENGTVKHGSLSICEYLNAEYPNDDLYPEDPLLKSRDKLLIEAFNEVIDRMREVIHLFKSFFIVKQIFRKL